MINKYSEQPDFVHKNKPYQVVLIISGGSPADVVNQIMSVLEDFERYGKPIQGTITEGYSSREVVRPKWGEG